MISITYFFPVLISNEGENFFIHQSIYAHITILVSTFLLLYSIFLFKNRKKQLLFNQISKFLLSATFFILFFTKGELFPARGMFVFIIPYILILLANRFIKKDEKLVQSADRIR
tara:strand:- start:1486 stop:1827 length:342 start_codon:yes stop_codon:yes gene_type:complete